MLLILFISLAFSATQFAQYYSRDITCAAQSTLWSSVNASSCFATGCTNQNNLLGRRMVCPAGPPTTFPPGWTVFESWTSLNCAGDPYQMVALPADACSGLWEGPTIKLECSTGLVYDCGTSIQTCAACASKTAAIGVCANGNPTTTFGMQSYRWRCSGVPTFAPTTASSTVRTTTTPAAAMYVEASILGLLLLLAILID